MSDKKSPFPSVSRPSQTKGSVIPLDIALAYEHLRKLSNGQLPVPETHSAKTTLIKEGTRQETPCAAFVLKGEIHERITHYSTGSGYQTYTVCIVGPGGVALAQALDPKHAGDPADVTLLTATETTVVWITSEHLQLLKRGDLCTDANLEARRQAQRTLVDQRVASNIALPFSRWAKKIRETESREVDPEELFKTLMQSHLALPKAQQQIQDLQAQLKEMAAALSSKTQETDTLRLEHGEQLGANKLLHVKIELLEKQTRKIAQLEKQVDKAQKQVGEMAQQNCEIVEQNQEYVRQTTDRSNEQFTRLTNIFWKIQGALAQMGVSLDRLGINARDLDCLRGLMVGPAADEPRIEKLGDTVPPDEIKEAPTPPPPDDGISQPFGDQPPVTLGPRTRDLPELAGPPSQRTPVSMPKINKTDVKPPARAYRSRMATITSEAMERECSVETDPGSIGSTTARMPAVKPLPKPPTKPKR